jgi:hypothetical protein
MIMLTEIIKETKVLKVQIFSQHCPAVGGNYLVKD